MRRFFAIVSSAPPATFGGFTCGLEFAFEPPVCVAAAPKVRDLFLNRGVEKCERIAKAHGFTFIVREIEEHAGDKSKAMYHCGKS